MILIKLLCFDNHSDVPRISFFYHHLQKIYDNFTKSHHVNLHLIDIL